MHSPFSHNLRGAYSGLANTARQAYNIQRHTHSCTVSYYIIRHPCYHSYTDTHTQSQHSHPPTSTCGKAQPGPQSRQEAEEKKKRGGRSTGEGCRRRREVLDVLTPFLEPSLSNDGDIAHGSFTPSLMPLHACSTERERGRRGGEEERKRGRGGGEERRGAGSPSLRVTLPPFLSRSPSRSRSLSLRHTHTNTRCVCILYVCVDLLPVVAYLLSSLPTSSPSSSSPPPPPPPPLSFPLQTFLLTSSDSACKEVKGEKNNNTEKSRDGFIFLPLLLVPSSSHKSFSDKTNN